jgi:putative MATE family efflux protein
MFRDKEYFSTLIKIGLPIAIQNLIASSLNAVGVLMIGQLGAVPLAAAGLANQVFFLLSLMLFGIASGSGIFTAQYWGKGDNDAIRKVVVICLGLTLAAGLLFTLLALLVPRWVMGIYSQDPAVIELGSQYLRIISISYLATAISSTFGTQMRSTGNVREPMLVSVFALSLGVGLNYILIFGKIGFPAMGVNGAALGTCLVRLLECGAMLAVTYLKKMPVAVRLTDLRGLKWAFVKRFLITVLPVAANETIWSIGVSIYNIIYAHIGTNAIAAINITSTIDSLAFVLFIGISNACAIMIGNRIGAGEEARAKLYARRSLFVGIGLALVVGAIEILLIPTLISYYKVPEDVAFDARMILIVYASALWLRVTNMTIIVGILRSGGDTHFSLILDTGTVWFVGIPLALLGAFVFHLPIYWVVVMVLGDELTKFIGGIYRFRTGKWVNNLAHNPA